MADEKINWKAEELDRAISNLTANLLRIMAGAGRTIDLERQLDETNKLAKEVYGQSPVLSEQAMNKALEIRWPHAEGKTEADRDFNEEQHTISWIVTYSLRVAAARITGNNSERSKWESELHRVLRRYEDEQRERHLRQSAPSHRKRAQS